MTRDEMRFLRRKLISDVAREYKSNNFTFISNIVRLIEFARYGRELNLFQ